VPSDEEGRFIAPLPHAGPYDLQVEWRNRGQIAVVPHVELRDTEAHIDLPDGAVAGRVVDADGKGVAGAKVRAKLNASTLHPVGGLAVTDLDGNFAIEGLLGGTWTLCAAEWTPMDVVVRDGERKEGVLLRVGH
jgi:carboxypeptidase family protein